MEGEEAGLPLLRRRIPRGALLQRRGWPGHLHRPRNSAVPLSGRSRGPLEVTDIQLSLNDTEN